MRKLGPQPRLLAQAKAAPQPALTTSPKANVSIASPVAPDDPADPFVVAEATALNKDPNLIYPFVRDQIKFEAYPGGLRGARGTLWAMAGNTLDKAILLSALLKASGFTTKYMHTTPNHTQAGQTALENLLLGMFPQTPVLLGCMPLGSNFDSPAQNGTAYNWANDYFWVEYGPSNTDLDPNIPGAQPGTTLGLASDATYSSVPASEMQSVTVKINAETYSQASGLFGFGPSATTVLTQNFYTWQLVGNIISTGTIVQSTAIGGLDFSATTFTYTPYLLIGSGGPDVTQDTVITGTDYQEYYTNFPLSSVIVTGIFVEVDANDVWLEQPHPYTHTLFDRIGPAARQGQASTQLTLPSPPAPAVTDFDIATLNILPTRLNLNTFQAQQTRLNTAYQNYLGIQQAYQALPTSGSLTAAQQLVAQQAADLSKYVIITENELVTMAYDGAADRLAGQLDTGYYSRIYPSAPRVTVANSSLDSSGNTLFYLDVLKNDMFVVDGANQNRNVVNSTGVGYEEIARGTIESTMEAAILSQVTGSTTDYDIGTVMATLGDPNQLIGLGPQGYNGTSSNGALSATSLSADAQTLILEAVANGDQIITPNQMVTINGTPTVGWWETDQYGHTVSHFPNGNHQALADYAGVNAFAQKYNAPIAKFIGQVEGIGLTGYAFAGGILEAVAQDAAFADVLKSAKTAVSGVSSTGASSTLQNFFKDFNDALEKLNSSIPKPDELGTSLIDNFAEGLEQGIQFAQKWLKATLPVDPEIVPFLTTPLGPLPTGVTPGTSPGVTVNITTDPIYTMPYNGNEFPVYDVNVVNTGPATDQFQIIARDNSGKFYIGMDYPGYLGNFFLTLQPGQAGEMNMCAIPGDPTTLPAVGSTSPFQVTVTGQTSGATATATTNYTVPAIPVISLTTDPQVLSVAPGGTVNANLIIGSLGNASPGPVSLTAIADPNIAINGLTTPVTVPLNGAVTEAVSFTAAANAANNIDYVAITATYAGLGGTQSVNFSIPVTVQTLGTCSLNAALSAQQSGMQGLGNTLAQMATDMNAALANPANPAYVTRVGGDLSVVLNALNAVPYLQSFAPSVTSAGSAVASATPGTLASALAALDATICPVGSAISQASTYNTQIYLNPNSMVAGPNLAVTFPILMQNFSKTMQVYSFSVAGVPSGLTAHFNIPSITLGPASDLTSIATYQSTPPTLTLTPGSSFTAPFTFNVVATPVGAPEFAISAPGTLLVRPQAISIDSVTATPAYGPPGTQFVITARVFAEVNQDTQAYLTMQPYNSSNTAVTFGAQSQYFTLTPTTTLQTITIGTVDSTNLANGSYTISVQGYDANPNKIFPGATASGSILVGAPLSGTLTANAGSNPPATVPPGNSAVQVALNISRDTTPNPVSTLLGTMAMKGVPRAMTLYQSGGHQYAYVCSDSVINIVDVTNPANMVNEGTFGGSVLTTEDGNSVQGYQVVACAIYNNNLILSYSRYDGNITMSNIPTHFSTFSLANPLAPVQVGSTVDILVGDSTGLYVAGNTALMYDSTTIYYPQYEGEIGQEIGDVWAANLANAPTTGAVSYLNDIYPCGTYNGTTQTCSNSVQVPNASYVNGVCTVNGSTSIPIVQNQGGPFRIGPGTAVNSSTSYFASTSAFGSDIENPSCPQISGQLLVINTSNPSAPAIQTMVAAPAMAFMTGVAVEGNTAVAVGDSTGTYYEQQGYVGTLVISSFDISNPQAPVLLDSVTTQLADMAGSFIVPLGSNTFAVGNTTLNNNAELVLVDASTPSALRYIPYNALFVANPTIAENGYFFALSSTPTSTTNSLSAFQLTEIVGPQLTVKLNLPNSGNAVVDPTSFNLAPSSATPGATYTTYEWDQPSPNTITFNVNVSGVNPGDVPTVVVGGEMDYTLPSLGTGTYVLPPLTVLCQQILSITPLTQAVSSAGNSASYQVMVTNPTSSQQTFVPSTLGIPASWGVQLPASVTVAPGGSQTFNLVLTTPLNASTATYNFYAAVTTAGGITASVGASLQVSGPPSTSGGNPNTAYQSFTASLNPSSITIGQNGSASYQISITNTGPSSNFIQASSVSPTFQASPSTYSGWQLNYNPSYLNVLPGLANTVTLTGTLSLPNSNYNSTAPGSYQIVLPVVEGYITQNLMLTVNIVAAGVTASLSPGSGTPSTTYTLYLTNQGSSADTFNLSAEGPLAQVVSVPASFGPVAAGKQTTVPVSFHPANFLTAGNYTLVIKVVSQANPAIVAYAQGTITVSPGMKGVSAAITPSPATVSPTPGSVSLLFKATNTGNVLDTYTASISNTTGPVSATLNGGQSIAAFPIPALENSVFPLNATLNSSANGTVTVTVTSTSDSTVTAKSTVTIGAYSPCDVNTDGKINVQDIQVMLNEALGVNPPANDLNGDGVVNVVDLQIDINGALNLGCTTGPQSQTAARQQSRARTLSASAGSGLNLGVVVLPASATDLGTLGGNSATAYGLNDLGQVVGASDTGHMGAPNPACPRCPVSHAFLWEAGQMTDLDGANAGNSVAYSINDAGQVAGVYSDPEHGPSGFLYSRGSATALSQVPRGRVKAINNEGQIAGDLWADRATSRQAFLWSAGTLTQLGTLAGTGSEAHAVNDSGQVAGSAWLSGDSAIHAFLYSGSALTDLGTLGGTNSEAFGIDSAGEVVGASQTAGGLRHAFLYSGGTMTDLHTLGGNESQADAIDGSGLIVGWSRDAGGERHAFLWVSGRMVDLNSLVSVGPGVWLEEATGINSAGQIVANGSNGHAYLIVLPGSLQ
jgi:probable HAF family extracellular repeat protein